MSKISFEMIEECYILGNKITQGNITNDTAVNYLGNLGMNGSSARKYISCIVALLTDGHYGSTVNETAIEYFCNGILIDFGEEKLKSALKVLKAHLEYQRGKNNLPGMWNIYSKYLEK